LAGSPLDPSLLHAAKDAAAWEEESGTLKRDISNWWERAPKATIKYAPSTAVWLRWLRADGVLYELIELLRRGDSGNSELIAERIATLSKPTRFERLVHDTDRRINGRHRGADIHGRALESLHNHTQEAVRFAQRWLALQKQRPGRSSSHASREQAERQRARLTETEALRDVVVGLGPRVLEEVSGALAHSRDIRPRFAAIHELRRAIERILNLFAARTPPAPTEPELSHILHSVLLRSPAIALHDDWSPVDSPGSGSSTPPNKRVIIRRRAG
jgi:hypothetical protein